MSSARSAVRPALRYALERRARLTVWQSLLLRAVAVLLLFGIALGGHWSDREGLRDSTDGHVSFVDVVYFTAVTVTTVGYGDIVPVTPRARLFDTFVVTPVRLFVWLIFLGTAYSFVLRRTWRRVNSRMIARTLHDHVIVAGYGAAGAAAVAELCRQGNKPDSIVVIDENSERLADAIAVGVVGLHGDASRNGVMETAGIDRARAVIVSPGRDDTTALIVLTARQMNPRIRITATVREEENEDLIRHAGAETVINPMRFGGHLLARATAGQQTVDYLQDLASASGRVMLRERMVAPTEVGLPLEAVATGLGVHIHRGDRVIGYWEPEAKRLQPGDIIVEITRTEPPQEAPS